MSLIFTLLWFTLKAIAWFIVLLSVIGLGRLLIGIAYTSNESITDTSELKKGDILLVGKDRLFHSWYIQLANVLTKRLRYRFWTHAGLYAGEGKMWEATPQHIAEKVVQEYLDSGHVVLALRHKYVTDEATMDQVIAFFKAQQHQTYDFRGTIFYALSLFLPMGLSFLLSSSLSDKLFHVEDAYFCSEIIHDAFKDAGRPLTTLDAWRTKPADFATNPQLVSLRH
jgi:uncharacterized protein YycO